MSNTSDEQLSKSRTTYRNLHQPPSPMHSPPPPTTTKKKILPSEGSDDDDDDDSTLPTFVNRFFFPENTPASAPSNDTGVFRAIRGQVIIHHDRSSKVQHEDELDDDDDDDDVEEELENLSVTRTNQGNYELHYDVDNPLEISYSMSLSSAETISDHSPSPVRHTSLIHINGFKSTIERAQTPVEPSDDDDDDDDDDTPSSIVSDTDHRETKNTIDHDTMKEQDEKLRTFRGWHLSMLKQIDEKLREIEQETTVPSPTSANVTKKAPVKSTTNKKPRKAFARPTIRRRFEANTFQRHHSPLPNNHGNTPRPRTPPVEKESRTLIINLPAILLLVVLLFLRYRTRLASVCNGLVRLRSCPYRCKSQLSPAATFSEQRPFAPPRSRRANRTVHELVRFDPPSLCASLQRRIRADAFVDPRSRRSLHSAAAAAAAAAAATASHRTNQILQSPQSKYSIAPEHRHPIAQVHDETTAHSSARHGERPDVGPFPCRDGGLGGSMCLFR